MEMNVSGQRKGIPILMYHSISAEAGAKYRQFAIPPTCFAEQMAFLNQQGYTPLTVSQFVQVCQVGVSALPVRPVVLTFDDGFLDFYTDALPIMQQYGCTATLYIATSYVEGTSRWMQRIGEGSRRILSWRQLQEISDSGIECGAHSHTHPQMDLIPLSQARQESLQSKYILEEHLGITINSFAYLYGYHTSAVKQLVCSAGYSSACATGYALNMEVRDPFALKRLLISPDMNIHAFAALLNGHDRQVTFAAYTKPIVPIWRAVRYGFVLAHHS